MELICVAIQYSSKFESVNAINLKKQILFSFLLCMVIINTDLHSQTVTMEPEPGFTEYATYYVSSFDLQTGASNFQLFRFRLQSTSYPVFTKVRFRASLISPALNIHSEISIVDLETGPFSLTSDIMIDNQELSANTTQLIDINGNVVPINVSINEIIEMSQFEQILSTVITTGRLAAGVYTFEVEIYSGPSEDNLSLTDTENISISVSSPSYISLESPGGAMADTSLNEIYNTFPFFIWYPQFCSQCDMEIRVAEFKPGIHSSVDDAIEDETMLPFDQTEDWEFVGNVTSFQYPVSNARLLEYNKVYVWQVKASLPTTVGNDEIISSINAFKIGDLGGTNPVPSDVNPIVQMLGQAFSSDEYNALFGPGGSLDGFNPNGTYTVNGNLSDQSMIMTIINQVISQNATITNVTVEE